MKRFWKMIVCSLLIVAMLATTAPAFAASSIARIMKVTEDYTRMRSAPEGGSVIANLRYGTKLLYWGVNHGAMCKVMTSSGAVGYVYGGYMATYGAMNLDSVYVTTAPTAMYTRANGTLVSAGALAKGRYVSVFGVHEDWVFVKTMSGQGGFVKAGTLAKVF